MSNDVHLGNVFLHGDDVYFPLPLVFAASPQKALRGNRLKNIGKVVSTTHIKEMVATKTGKPANPAWLTSWHYGPSGIGEE